MTEQPSGQTPAGENNIAAGNLVPAEPDEPDYVERSSRLYRALVMLERAAACTFLVGMLGLIVMQVVSRYIFNTPFTWTEELARFTLLWFTFLSAGFVMARRIHIAVDIVASKLGRRAAIAMDALSLLIVAAASGIMTWTGAEFAVGANRLLAPATSIPMSVVYSAAVAGFALICLHAVVHLVLTVRHPEMVPDAMENIEREGV